MEEKRNIPFSPPDVGEEEIREVAEAVRSGWITTGPRTKEFEKRIAEYCGVNRAVCLNSATACLESILRVLEIGPGDEVITSAYTYTASASPVCHVGAKLVLVDISKENLEMDYDRVEKLITEKTKAIIRWISEEFPAIMTVCWRLRRRKGICSGRLLKYRRRWEESL